MNLPDAPEPLALLRAVADVLDSLGIAAYVLDESERTLLWNRSFLRLFPEHGGRIFSGETYERNLFRFFEARAGTGDPVLLSRMVRDAQERNRHQVRPIVFEHHGRRLRSTQTRMRPMPVPPRPARATSTTCRTA
jgi:PAS domain-containing protein